MVHLTPVLLRFSNNSNKLLIILTSWSIRARLFKICFLKKDFIISIPSRFKKNHRISISVSRTGLFVMFFIEKPYDLAKFIKQSRVDRFLPI